MIGTIDPKYTVAYSGSNVSISCYTLSDHFWYKNDARIEGHNYYTTDSIIFEKAAVKDSGTYKCYGILKQRTVEKLSPESNLFVGGIDNNKVCN